MELNKIWNECCLETMQRMDDDSVDMVVTSPPYDNLRDYKGYHFPFEDIARGLYRVMKKGGVVVWVVGDQTVKGSETGTSFRQALYFKEVGFNLHDTMIYHKHSPPLTHKRYEQHFEYMFVFVKGEINTFNPIKEQKNWKDNRTSKAIRREADGTNDIGFASKSTDKIIGNVWRYNIGGGHVTSDKFAHQHPAIFPEALAYDHIKSWSNVGDIVYDPFTGSGTTAKMAIVLGRKYIGSEISSEYCELAEKRIQNEKRQERLNLAV